MENLGKRLKECRKAMHLRQEETAKMLDIGYSTYRRYEQSGKGGSFEDAVKMAKLFHVSLDYLGGLVDEAETGE